MEERESKEGDVNGLYEEERWDGSEKGGDDTEGIWEEPGEARIWKGKVWGGNNGMGYGIMGE